MSKNSYWKIRDNESVSKDHLEISFNMGIVMEILRELWDFLRVRKKLWLAQS